GGDHASDAASSPSDATPQGSDAGPSACVGLDGTPHMFTSIADTLARLQGSWLTCRGAIVQPDGTIGIEFQGGMAYLLVQGPDGAVRGNSPEYARTVTVDDTGAINGADSPDRFQLDLEG